MSALMSDPAQLTARGAEWTAREIAQQPQVWRETQRLIASRAAEFNAFLTPLAAEPALRVILTGAGSSAFIGRCLAPALLERTGRRTEAIATTDLVSSPRQFLQPAVPTLLVSFARSGNSPESVAAVELCSRKLERCHHLVVTCNGEGALHRRASGRTEARSLLLPPETHDRSFAMTSSYTAMLYAGLALLGGSEPLAGRLDALCNAARFLLDRPQPFDALAAERFERVVYLGSGALAGLADESALKLLELTDGRVVGVANTSLGFRHGPKSIVNGRTLVCVFLSNDPLTRRYDLDLLAELRRDGIAGRVLAVSAHASHSALVDGDVVLPGLERAGDAELCLPYTLCGQLLGYFSALRHGISPDNPCSNGAVNRVVRGVTIHEA